MNPSATVTLDIGAEELFAILRILGMDTLPGLGESPMAGLDQDQIQRAQAAGLNSLRARGWVEVTSSGSVPQVKVDQTVAALLLTCASAQHTLFLSRVPVDSVPEVSYFHFGPYLIAIHTSPEPGIHRLVGTTDYDGVLSCVAQALHLDDQLRQQSVSSSEVVTVDQETLDLVTDAIKQSRLDEGVSLLLAHGVSLIPAQQVVSAINALKANSMVAMLQLESGEIGSGGEGFALIESQIGFWLLEAFTTSDGTMAVTIQPISSEDCKERVTKLIPQFARNDPG